MSFGFTRRCSVCNKVRDATGGKVEKRFEGSAQRFICAHCIAKRQSGKLNGTE